MPLKPSYVAPAHDPQSLVRSVVAQKQYTVLLVDDSDVDRLTFQRYMGAFSKVTFLEAETGARGLLQCQQQLPDLILLDYRLPDLDGLEFLQALRESMRPVPPVIMLTGEGSEPVAVEAMKLGVRDYLVKGTLTKASLSEAIRRVLVQQALQDLVSQQKRQQQLVTDISLRISQAASLAEILATAATGARELLACDRTVVYRFEPDLSGTIVAESVLSDWTASLSAQIEDTCFKVEGLEQYEQGYICAITDLDEVDIPDCYREMLERFEVKANLVVPILVSGSRSVESSATRKVWGLLIAHQCRGPREWQKDELALLSSVAVQLGIAIRQAELVSHLEARNQDLDEFARVASHDLRAPLRAITNLASWLEEDLSGQIPSENSKQLKLLQLRAQRMDDFIAGLLNYARAGYVEQAAAWVSPQSLIDEVIESLDAPSGFSVVTDVGAIAKMHTHKLLLQQVLINLIGNAIKYHNRPDGQVTITAEGKGKMVVFSVIDDGPGIDPSNRHRIFELFKTLNSRDDIESTGIGLSIVKKLVEQQGGQVMVCSEPGAGSTFTFSWPKQ